MNQKLRVTCPLDCPDACSLIATIDVEANQLLQIEGDLQHPITRGFACVKTYRYPERHHHPDRPLFPMKRVGQKGLGQFEKISWEQALDEIAERLKGIIDQHGPEAVLPYHYAGTMGLHQYEHPLTFFRAIGASQLDTTICATAGTTAWMETYGSPRMGIDPQDLPQARLILLWGINALHTNSHLTPLLKEARHNGARIVHIDPYHNLTSRFADQHIPIRPGTDAALAYAMARVIIQHGLHDHAYIERATLGFEAYRSQAEEWTLEQTERITGIPAATIEALALEFGRTPASFIRTSYGITRHPGGGNALRSIILLPALTGAWQYPGGGALLTTSGTFPLNRSHLGGQQLANQPHHGYFRPNRQARTINMTQIGTALTTAKPPIRALFVFNSNPAVVAPRSNLVLQGLARDDLFTVVLENAPTETTKYADYLLPATTFLEHPDLYTAYGHFFLSYNQQLLEPQGQARSNTEIFAGLALRLGLDEPTLFWDAETLARSLLDTQHPWMEGISFEQLATQGYLKLNTPSPFLPFRDSGANGSIRFDPPPQVILTQPTEEFPLILMTPPAKHFMNTTYGHIERLTRAEGTQPTLLVNPADAERFGLTDGQQTRIRSAHGSVVRQIKVSTAPIEGTVVLEGTWWAEAAPDGKGINHLTSEQLTDLGRGSTFHSNPVTLEAP